MEKCGTNFEIDFGPIADTTVFVGNYPFSSFASATWPETQRHLTALGIFSGSVSPIEAVFREDSEQTERQLADAIADSPQWHLFKTIDPMKSYWRHELLSSMREHTFAGIRLFSLYHGYSLASSRAAEVFDLAAEHQLPVQVFCRMQDVRLEYGHNACEPSQEELISVLAGMGHRKNTLLLSGLNIYLVEKLFKTEYLPENVFFDTSRMQGHWKTFEIFSADVIEKHFVFGSLWPINSPECPLTQLRYSSLSSIVRKAVVSKNFKRFLTS